MTLKDIFTNIILNLGNYNYYPCSLFNYKKDPLPNKQIKYCASSKMNSDKNDCSLIKSEFDDLFEYQNYILEKEPVKFVNYGGIFYTKRKNILSRSRNFYRKIIKTVDYADNVLNGHFLKDPGQQFLDVMKKHKKVEIYIY